MELLKYMCILFQAYEVDIIWAVNHQHNVFLRVYTLITNLENVDCTLNHVAYLGC